MFLWRMWRASLAWWMRDATIRYSSIELRLAAAAYARDGELCLYPAVSTCCLGQRLWKDDPAAGAAFLHPVRGMRCRWGDMEVTPDAPVPATSRI
ncbi:MAG: hypothetical protein ACLTCB_07750 [Merdibacter sp.]